MLNFAILCRPLDVGRQQAHHVAMRYFLFALLLAGCDSSPIGTDTVLTAERHAHTRLIAFAQAADVCAQVSMHLPIRIELAELYASGVAVDPGNEEWLHDGTAAYRDASGEMHSRQPLPDEQFTYRCVIELPIPHN
jgi:hypothetical protein